MPPTLEVVEEDPDDSGSGNGGREEEGNDRDGTPPPKVETFLTSFLTFFFVTLFFSPEVESTEQLFCLCFSLAAFFFSYIMDRNKFPLKYTLVFDIIT